LTRRTCVRWSYSNGLEGELLFQCLPDNALPYTTMDQLNSPGASALWARTESAHRQIVSRLLARAVAADAAEE
jgi:hypothetical protein